MPRRFFEWTRHIARRMPTVMPSSCALCGISGNTNLCDGCHTQFFSRHLSRCAQCGLPLAYATGTALQRCGECVKTERKFDATIVATDYVAPVDHLVLALKFGNRLALAPLFGSMLRDAMLREQTHTLPTLLAVVPLSDKRLAERGFNQALEIAKPLAQAIAVPLAPRLVERTRDTLMQAQLPNDERHKNVRNAFVVAGDNIDAVRGQHVGVVDDVITSLLSTHELACFSSYGVYTALIHRFSAATSAFDSKRTLKSKMDDMPNASIGARSRRSLIVLQQLRQLMHINWFNEIMIKTCCSCILSIFLLPVSRGGDQFTIFRFFLIS